MKISTLLAILLGVFICYAMFRFVRALLWTLIFHWMGIALFLTVAVVFLVWSLRVRHR